ncbi:MAG: Holliday junction resolvase RuvX [Planctomycetales bacterium]|jgi:putative Holliday junction resolvase|nr:Holliday junction resolvase RuvX [Planctomycetales bacterium]MBN8628710.1 Holliday junction resolvase RuvX [Planctomycetota bacterium]
MSDHPPGRLAAIDYGTVRIGVAVSNASQTLASPYEIFTRRAKDAEAGYFRRLVSTESITRFVVGLPVHTNGRESQKSIEAQEFGRWLQETTGIPVDYFDERFTTAAAEEILLAQGLTKQRRKERLDKLAAQILLTAYLESPERGAAVPRALDD